MRVVRGIALAVLLGVGCAGPARDRAGERSSSTSKLHTYVSAATGIFANAYIVETEQSVVVIDATLTVTDARKLRAQVDALSKPLAGVFITHGHPDHYNGLTELVAGRGQVLIYATDGVDRVIREWDDRKEQQWKGMFGDEWPTKRTFPNRAVKSGETIAIDGVQFTAHDLGPGESHHDSYWIARDQTKTYAFIGDLIFDNEHSYVSDGHTTEWLANIERLRAPLAGLQLYPGHGSPGGAELLDRQQRYLEAFRSEVRRLAQGKPQLTDSQKKELVTQMTTFLPDGKLTFLIAAGADAVAAELAASPASSGRR